MRNARIDMRLPEKQKHRWQREASKRKLELSELIRRAVEAELADGVPSGKYASKHGRKAENKGEAAGAR